MKLRKLSAIFVFAFLYLFKSYAQETEYFSRQKLSNDIDSLYSSISDIHPFMFSHISKPEFERNLEQTKQALKDSMNIFEFYRLTAPLINKIGDGHTSLNYPIDILIERKIKVFPYNININKSDSIASIVHDWSGSKDKIPYGAVILSINGYDSKKLIQECLNLVQGELFHFKVKVLNGLFPLILHSILNDTVYTVTYQYKGEVYKKDVEGMDSGQYWESLNKPFEKDYILFVKDYILSIDEKTSSAVIRFDQFGFDENRFKNFLDSTFLLLKNKSITNLIIDLRKNGGGVSTRGDELFQYISPVPFQQFGKTIVKASDIVHQRYNTPGKGLFILEAPLIPLIDNPLRFKGNIYLLTSNLTFSSAASFSNAFQHFNMGKIVGEETGGMVVCFGNVFDCKLPNTGLHFGVSWQKYYLYGANEETPRGVIPDFPVPEDQAMEKVMSMLQD